jgi:hypothetical protein
MCIVKQLLEYSSLFIEDSKSRHSPLVHVGATIQGVIPSCKDLHGELLTNVYKSRAR